MGYYEVNSYATLQCYNLIHYSIEEVMRLALKNSSLSGAMKSHWKKKVEKYRSEGNAFNTLTPKGRYNVFAEFEHSILSLSDVDRWIFFSENPTHTISILAAMMNQNNHGKGYFEKEKIIRPDFVKIRQVKNKVLSDIDIIKIFIEMNRESNALAFDKINYLCDTLVRSISDSNADFMKYLEMQSVDG